MRSVAKPQATRTAERAIGEISRLRQLPRNETHLAHGEPDKLCPIRFVQRIVDLDAHVGRQDIHVGAIDARGLLV
jgi:hypothetical protein